MTTEQSELTSVMGLPATIRLLSGKCAKIITSPTFRSYRWCISLTPSKRYMRLWLLIQNLHDQFTQWHVFWENTPFIIQQMSRTLKDWMLSSTPSLRWRKLCCSLWFGVNGLHLWGWIANAQHITSFFTSPTPRVTLLPISLITSSRMLGQTYLKRNVYELPCVSVASIGTPAWLSRCGKYCSAIACSRGMGQKHYPLASDCVLQSEGC